MGHGAFAAHLATHIPGLQAMPEPALLRMTAPWPVA
jgi:hypothetical protein